MPSRNSKTRLLTWRIAGNKQLADAVKEGGWEVAWMFVNIIASVDNLGRMEGGKYQLRDMFFPHQEDVIPEDIECFLKHLADVGLIIYYGNNGTKYIQLPKIGKYSCIRGNQAVESDFPEPNEEDISRWESLFNEEYTPFICKRPVKEKGDPAYLEVVEFWNSTSLPKCRMLSDMRLEKLKKRWQSQSFKANWKIAVTKINDSDFCNGKNNQNWKATFDWFIKNDDNWLKAFEGKYDNRTSAKFDSY